MSWTASTDSRNASTTSPKWSIGIRYRAIRAYIPPASLFRRLRRTHRSKSVSSPPVEPLEGKKAIVTGASSGIGAATARAFPRAGASVAAGARRVDRLAELGDGAVTLELDVTDPESCEAFVANALVSLGGLDILVNNAGLALGRDPFDESNVPRLRRMTALCLPHIADSGYIVNIGSIAGRQAYENAALYVTTKFAVRGFTYALREDLLGRPIHITTVDPGLVESGFSLVRFRGDEEAARKVYEGVEPATPDDIAECVLFVVTRPERVHIDELVVKAPAQSSPSRILRDNT